MSISSLGSRYGYSTPLMVYSRNQDGTYTTSTKPGGSYFPKSYEQIKAEREGDYSYPEKLKQLAEEAAKIPPAELLAMRDIALGAGKATASKQAQTTPLTEADIARLSEKYRPDMSMAELDELLVELLDLGAITEQDRNLALGLREVPDVMLGAGMVMVNYAEPIDESYLYDRSDLTVWLSRIDELLAKQSAELKRMGHNPAALEKNRASCQRLEGIFSALRLAQ